MSRIPFATTDLRAALLGQPTGGGGPIDADTVRLIRAPGRVNLIGEHTDYNLGFVLPAAIDLEVRMAVALSPDRRVELTRLETGERASFDLDQPRPRDGSWLDYIAGVAWALAEAGIPTSGIRAVIASNLPENAGLSSSAAIELAAAWALGGDAIAIANPLDVARICQRAENGYVGVMSGLMDQFASACGAEGRALLLDCRSLEWRPVRLPMSLRLVVLHSGSPRKLDGSAYNERRSQCEAAVAALREADPTIESLRDVSPALLAAEGHRLDPVVARRAEHVVAENERVEAAVIALEEGDLATVGELFAASHRSLRELYEVTSPELDALVEIATGVAGVVAARMTGAGFGGCTVNLVEPDAVDDLAAAVTRQYQSRTGLLARVLPVRAAAGAGWLETPEPA
ncbi:MAG: galactokinase [Chloroflexi bacterium]|nr:galactokinase [Chloroflexota bacterium]